MKGNYEVDKNPETGSQAEDGADFEKEVLKKLGGSVAFVRGRKHIDAGDE